MAAAILSFAFLPVAYSRVAVTDVGSMIGVALALYGSVRAHEEGRTAALRAGRRRRRAGHGLQVHGRAGAAAAGHRRARRGCEPTGPAPLAGLAAGGALALVVFLALNPYVFGSFDTGGPTCATRRRWRPTSRSRARTTAAPPTTSRASAGASGWAAALAALAGAVIELRRDLVRGLMLAAVPVALFVYLSFQARYFGRWLLPAYPALAMLAAVALVRAADALPARRGALPLRAAAAGARWWWWRSPSRVAADVRTALVLGREDTRLQARDWLEQHYPPELRVAIEPAVPGRYYRSNPDGQAAGWLSRCPRARRLDLGRASHTRLPAGAGCARSSSPASSRARTAACGPRPTTCCSHPRWWTTTAATATAS